MPERHLDPLCVVTSVSVVANERPTVIRVSVAVIGVFVTVIGASDTVSSVSAVGRWLRRERMSSLLIAVLFVRGYYVA